MTVRELAEHLQLDPSTIYRLIRKKERAAFRVGRDWRFKIETIEQWMRKGQKLG